MLWKIQYTSQVGNNKRFVQSTQGLKYFLTQHSDSQFRKHASLRPARSMAQRRDMQGPLIRKAEGKIHSADLRAENVSGPVQQLFFPLVNRLSSPWLSSEPVAWCKHHNVLHQGLASVLFTVLEKEFPRSPPSLFYLCIEHGRKQSRRCWDNFWDAHPTFWIFFLMLPLSSFHPLLTDALANGVAQRNERARAVPQTSWVGRSGCAPKLLPKHHPLVIWDKNCLL